MVALIRLFWPDLSKRTSLALGLAVYVALFAWLVAICPAQAQTVPKVELTCTPEAGVETVAPTCTWATTAVTSCSAFGGWSGAKALSGTESLPATMKSQSYGMLCVTAAGDVVLTWTAPTQNTDGSALTNLSKYRIYKADTQAKLPAAAPIEVAGTLKTHTLQNLAPGTWWFAVSALNDKTIESTLSGAVTTTIASSEVKDEAAVTVEPRPKAPALTIEVTR